MEFICRIARDAGLDFGERNRALFKQYLKANPGVLLKITPMLPESNKQRRFYHGAVLPLWAYLDGKDYRNSEVLADLHEIAKFEFNGHEVIVDGRKMNVGRSTKGRELAPYLERVIEHLVDNYGIDPSDVLEPKKYKEFADTVFMEGNYETYIDYLVADGRLRKPDKGVLK
jgi:hypothetical protein